MKFRDAVGFWSAVVAAGVGLALGFGGRTQPRIALAVAVAPLIVRAALDAAWRRRTAATLRGLWADAGRPDAPEWRKWLAGAVFLGLPAIGFYSHPPLYHFDSGDTWAVVPTAASLVREGNLEISEAVPIAPAYYLEHRDNGPPLPYGAKWVNGRVYSAYPAGMVLPAVPVVAVAWICGADLGDPETISGIDRWGAMLVAGAGLTAFFRLALALASTGAAWWAGLLLAVGSGMCSTVAQTFWQHGGVVLGLTLILIAEFEPRFRRGWAGAAVQGVAAGWMFACRLNSGLLLLLVGLWILARSPLRGIRFGIFGLLGMLPWAVLYLAVYGTPAGPSSAQTATGFWVRPTWDAWLGLMVSPGRGFVPFQLWIVLAGAAWLPLGDRAVRGWKPLAAAAVLAQSLMLVAWWCWWGGACWGSRLMTDVLPFAGLLALPAVERLARTVRGRAILAALAALSAGPHLLAFSTEPFTDPWDANRIETFWLLPRLK